MNSIVKILVLHLMLVGLVVVPAGCSSNPSRALPQFEDQQKAKISAANTFNQAEFDFWAAVYAPTRADLEQFKDHWVQHGNAFPDSRAMIDIEKALERSSDKPVLLALFMSSYENADIKEKALGWTVAPSAAKIVELSENDLVLRTLMPVKNSWARYFLLTYNSTALKTGDLITVSNKTSRVQLELK